MKKLIICYLLLLLGINMTKAQSIEFLADKFSLALPSTPTCPLVFQASNCGDQVYEVNVCNVSDVEKTFKIEIEIVNLINGQSNFNFTDPMDFTLNTKTGKLEATITLEKLVNEPPPCKILRFKGKSLSYQPDKVLVATLMTSGLTGLTSDCIAIKGVDSGTIINNGLVSQLTLNVLNSTLPSLLPMPNLSNPLVGLATINNQFKRIDGTLTIDQDYEFASKSILQMGENAKIVILSGKKLTLTGVKIFGCDKMWDKIQVLNGATLIMNDCNVRDGLAAVTVGDIHSGKWF